MWLEIYTPQQRPTSVGNYSSTHTLFSIAFSFSQTHTNAHIFLHFVILCPVYTHLVTQLRLVFPLSKREFDTLKQLDVQRERERMRDKEKVKFRKETVYFSQRVL